MSQRKIGILLSYINLAVSMVVNIFLTPYLIYVLGDIDYSMYKVMQSFAGPLSMFHFGISTIVTRSIIRYQTIDDYNKKDKETTLALSLLSSFFLCLFLFVIGIFMFNAIPMLYSNTYSTHSIVEGQYVFMCFVVATIFHMMTDAFSGCIVGHEKYVVSSIIQLFKSIFRVLLIIILLIFDSGIITVALADLLVSLIVFVSSSIYSIFILKEVPKLHYFDKKQLVEIISFGFALFLQAFVNQINNSVDTMILGVYVSDKSIITMYSSALAIYAIYNSLVSVVTNYFLPSATKLVSKNASGKELTDFVIKPGRIQAIVAIGCIFGFIAFGKEFIILWIGEKYIDAYWVILMLMIPVTIPLVENAAISILDASLKRIYRSSVLAGMAVLNVVVSIVLVKYLGFWGAALGTMLSLVIGHGFLMNIYYAKVFNMEIIRMFFSIFKGIITSGLFTLVLCIPMMLLTTITWVSFMIKVFVFIIIYVVILLAVGLNNEEKEMINQLLIK